MRRPSSFRSSSTAKCAGFPTRAGASSSSWTGGRSPPTRSWSRRVRSRRRTSRSSRESSTPGSGRRTARATGARATCRGDRARGRGRKHRLPDRQGALGYAQGHPLGRHSSEAAAAAPGGRDLFWWLTKTGLIRKTVESRLGQRLKDRDTLIGSSPRELKRRYGIEIKPRATQFRANGTFEDASEVEVDAVIWATGYRPDYSWIDLPILDSNGRLRHRRGVTDVPGLYFLGLTWQQTRGSALIGWVKDDAAFLAGADRDLDGRGARIARERATKQPAPRPGHRQEGSGRRCTTTARTGRRAQPNSRPRPRGWRRRGAPRSSSSRTETSSSSHRPGQQGDRGQQRPHARLQRIDPGTDAEGSQGSEILVARGQRGRPRSDRSLARICGSRTSTTDAPDAGADGGGQELHLPGALSRPGPRTGTTRTSVRTTARRWASTGTSSSSPNEPEYWPPAHREVLLTLDDILLDEEGRVAPFSARRRLRRHGPLRNHIPRRRGAGALA